MDDDVRSHPPQLTGTQVSRREVLGMGVAGVAGAAGLFLLPSVAGAGEQEDTHHHDVDDVDPGELGDLRTAAMISRNSLNGTALYYEPTGARTSFSFEQNFYDQLVRWRNQLGNYVPASWGGPPSRIYSYGAYVNKPGMHGQGRGFDIARVVFSGPNGDELISCRADQWGGKPGAPAMRRRYFALSASLHHRFQHVLTYKFDGEHRNHIHVDNAIYGNHQRAMLDTGASARVQHVQSVCRYIWGHETTIDGVWGSQSRSHSTAVLRRAGVSSGTIVGNNYNWRMFNYHSLMFGTGKASY